jgi:hypothetical protein
VFAPVLPIAPQSDALRASSGWVDARLAFSQRPDLAQALGGTITTNQQARLPVRGGLAALVFVEGRLLANGVRTIMPLAHGYHWVSIGSDVAFVTCSGLCVLAAQGRPPATPLEPPGHAGREIAFTQILPWFATAAIPPGSLGTLRYNVAYDDRWSAYLDHRSLTHIRLDGVVNGWLLPARTRPQPLILIETVAAAQFLLELLALMVAASAAAFWLARRLRSRSAKRRLLAYR